jgi:hypothetical protein
VPVAVACSCEEEERICFRNRGWFASERLHASTTFDITQPTLIYMSCHDMAIRMHRYLYKTLKAKICVVPIVKAGYARVVL